MTLPTSGTIKMSNIMAELGITANTTTNVNNSSLRNLAKKPSGTIKWSDFYGKSNVKLISEFLGTVNTGLVYNASPVSVPYYNLYNSIMYLNNSTNTMYPKTIEGYPSPNDPTLSNFLNITTDVTYGTMRFSGTTSTDIPSSLSAPKRSLILRASGGVTPDNVRVRGPIIILAQAVSLTAGSNINFWWKVASPAGISDVFGWLVEVNTKNTITILDFCGTTPSFTGNNWTLSTVTIPTTGSYKIVFLNGAFNNNTTIDASLYIADVFMN